MRRVLLLGATSAIAAEAAVLYARRGDRLHLVGRNPDKLAAVAARCAPATVTTATADFTRLDANAGLVRDALDALGGGVDVALIAHGDLGDQLASEQDFDAAVGCPWGARAGGLSRPRQRPPAIFSAPLSGLWHEGIGLTLARRPSGPERRRARAVSIRPAIPRANTRCEQGRSSPDRGASDLSR
jgi:NAD(P)-dependent dehydrogenase (short-subunit alcohol dehydrogenase family)